MKIIILTKYVSPTGNKDSKIIARGRGKQLTLAYNYELNYEENHMEAARVLADRYGFGKVRTAYRWPIPNKCARFVAELPEVNA